MATTGPTGHLRLPQKITRWYIAAAVLFIVLGMFAIIEPGIAALGVTLLVGWMLIFGGVTHLIGGVQGGWQETGHFSSADRDCVRARGTVLPYALLVGDRHPDIDAGSRNSFRGCAGDSFIFST